MCIRDRFLVPDGRTLYFIDFFTFYLFPVPFNFLLYDICKSKFRKGALFLSVSYLINMGAAVLLQCMGIVDIFLDVYKRQLQHSVLTTTDKLP